MKPKKEIKTTSFLSENIELKGKLYTKEGIRIDGKVVGCIQSDGPVYIGKSAKIEAEISSHSVISSGSISGNVKAQEEVRINYPGVLEGNIHTSNFTIEKGVFFTGRCQILIPYNNPKNDTPKFHFPRKAISHRE